MTRDLAANAVEIPLGPAADLPADFRRYHVSLERDGFSARRTLGLEVSHAEAQGPAPADLPTASPRPWRPSPRQGEPDTVTALARLAVGQPGPETEAMIAAYLPPIADCWDCADFFLVPLLWIRARYAAALSPALLAEIDRTILGYRYWLDEPGNDVQWYFSENHALLFHTAAYLAGHLLPDRPLRPLRPHRRRAVRHRPRPRPRLARPLRALGDGRVQLRPLLPHRPQGPDRPLRPRPRPRHPRPRRPRHRPARWRSSPTPRITASSPRRRAAPTSTPSAPAASLELSAIARLLWGRGSYGARFHALPQLALCLRDHGLALPDLAARAIWQGEGAQEWCFRQGENGFAALYHYKTRAYAMGSAARYRWFEWGYQETLIHARLGTEPQAQILDQPPRRAHPRRLRPPLLLGRQRLDSARAAVPRSRRRRLRWRGATAGPHPRLVPAIRLRRNRRHGHRRLRPLRRRPRRPPRRRPPPRSHRRPQRRLRAPPRRPARPLAPPPRSRATLAPASAPASPA